MPPDLIPVGTGSGRVPSDPKPVGVSSGGVTNGIWDRARSSIFSLWARLLRPEQKNDDSMERTHPDCHLTRLSMRPVGTGLLVGTVFDWDTPTSPSQTTFKYSQRHSRGGTPQALGRSGGQRHGGAASQ